MGPGRSFMAGWALLFALAGPSLAQAAQQEAGLLPYRVEGDGIPRPLTTVAGDAVRGRAIVANRQLGLCLLCHAGPLPEERFQGNLAPNLAGSGERWSEAQLRLRIVDAGRINPDTIMPAYYRIDGLTNVAPAVRGKPILDAQQVEDVVAYLRTLKEKEGD
jgi:sulfur-oxidizing protein SoxX